MRAAASEIERLRARIAELEAELAEWRRQHAETDAEPLPFEADELRRLVAPALFSPSLWRVALALLRSRGRVFTVDELAQIAGERESVSRQLGYVSVSRLRRIFRDAYGDELIESDFGEGYRVPLSGARAALEWLGYGTAAGGRASTPAHKHQISL